MKKLKVQLDTFVDSDTNLTKCDLKIYKDNKKVCNNLGLKDSENNIIIPAKYEHIYPFVNGYAIVSVGCNLYMNPTYFYGIINEAGEEIQLIEEGKEGEKGLQEVLQKIDELREEREKLLIGMVKKKYNS